MERRRKWASILAGVLALLMVLGLAAPVLNTVGAANSISDLKEDLSDLDQKKKELQNQLNQIEKDISTVTQRKELLDQQMVATQQEIDSLDQLIVQITDQITVTQGELDQALADEAYQQELLKKRVRATYEQGTPDYVEMLLSSDSYTDFLTNMDIITAIFEYDKDLEEQLTALREEIALKKQQLEDDKAQQEDAKQQLEVKKTDLASQVEESNQMIASLEANKAAGEKQQAAYEAEEARINDQIDELVRQAEEEAKKKQAAANQPVTGTTYSGGQFVWPAPQGRIGDPFGYRICPFHGKELHRGQDFPTATGTPIVAAAAGTVITAGYSSSYGNYVVINHGGGLTTLYAHNSSLLVKVGQTVSQGQQIAKAGSTGNSTGSHCHFEVKLNGVLQNPMNYLQ